MTHAEQHRMIIELMDYRHRMSRDEDETFDMFVKRNNDDEDLDAMSQRRLLQMHEKYVQRRKQ